MLRFLDRNEIDTIAWDACVAASAQRIIYGYSWYLDAVTSGRDWQWAGLVMIGEVNDYQAVMPVPLRRRRGVWVVHQPLFCQFLAVFSPDETLDVTPFLQAVQQRYRYAPVLCLRREPPPLPGFDHVRQRTTHRLDLSAGYASIRQNYSHDRQTNLRRANTFGWTLTDSTDSEPLLTLFRDNHADGIEGGVGEWAYTMLRGLIDMLHKRGLVTLRYALYQDHIEAGVLLVQANGRIIYLFNAASETGRRGNARTLLIDAYIRANAGQSTVNDPLIFDFESPEKESIAVFYRSFGAVEDSFWEMRWNRLTAVERWVRKWVNNRAVMF